MENKPQSKVLSEREQNLSQMVKQLEMSQKAGEFNKEANEVLINWAKKELAEYEDK